MSETYTIRATVCFIHSYGLRTRRGMVFEDILLRRIPENGIVHGGVGNILCNPFDPGRESVDVFSLRCGHGDLLNKDDIRREIVP